MRVTNAVRNIYSLVMMHVSFIHSSTLFMTDVVSVRIFLASKEKMKI